MTSLFDTVSVRRCAIALAAVTATLGAASAYAGCGDPRTIMAGQPRVTFIAPLKAHGAQAIGVKKDIVGTWLVTYTSGGNAAGQAYIQWHGDGTEWENINFPIEGGNICMGSWKTLDADHVARNHYGWLYTGGILTGYFNENETATLGHDGTYTGVIDMKIYDLDGNLQVEFPEASSAVLISP